MQVIRQYLHCNVTAGHNKSQRSTLHNICLCLTFKQRQRSSSESSSHVAQDPADQTEIKRRSGYTRKQLLQCCMICFMLSNPANMESDPQSRSMCFVPSHRDLHMLGSHALTPHLTWIVSSSTYRLRHIVSETKGSTDQIGIQHRSG